MRALIVLLLLTVPALANEPGCYEQNAFGDKFIFTSDPAVVAFSSPSGMVSECSYGIDGTSGYPTIICDHGAFKSTILAVGNHQVLIGGQRWSYVCPGRAQNGV